MIRHLPYFVVAAQELNLAKAALKLGLSASALTRRIQNLEQELGGVKLFERSQSGLALTAAGRAFKADIEAPMEELTLAAKRAERMIREERDALRVGYNPISLRQGFLRDAVETFQAENDDIRLELVPMMSRHQADRLRSGDLDVGILSVPFEDEDFGVEGIGDFPLLLTLHKDHPKADAEGLTIGDLKDEPFVGINREWMPSAYDGIAGQFEQAGVPHRIICETHCEATIANLIGLGVGIGFVTPAAEGTPAEGLMQRRVDGFTGSLPLSLVWQRRADAKVRKFVAAIGDALPV